MTYRSIATLRGIDSGHGLIAALNHLQLRADNDGPLHLIAAGEQTAGIALELLQDLDDGSFIIELRADP